MHTRVGADRGAAHDDRERMTKMFVKDIMTTPVVQVGPDCPLGDVVALMRERSISCILICRDEVPIGIITERDLPHWMGEPDHSNRVFPKAEDLMSSPVASIETEISISDAAAVAEERAIRHLPVVDERGRLVGITTQTDLLRCYARELEILVARAFEKLESANASKGRFLANMCHEIRTPMTAILGFADLPA